MKKEKTNAKKGFRLNFQKVPYEAEGIKIFSWDKFEHLIKLIPALTVLCYICGFIVYKSFLLSFGIVETEIINLKFLEAGLLYLIIAPFILFTPLMTPKKVGYINSIAIALLVFIIYNNCFGSQELDFLWKASLYVIGLNSLAFVAWKFFKHEIIYEKFDLTESPLIFAPLVIVSFWLFSIYFKEIRPNFGGGKGYNKVLILKEKKDNLIKTDSLNRTDTLNIIYENDHFLYFKYLNTTKSLQKDLIEGEIFCK